MADEEKKKKKKKKPKSTRTIAIVALATVLSIPVFARAFFLATYKNPSGSMLPTIPVAATVFSTTVGATPKRGMVIVFKYPEHPQQSFMKRVVGVGGDKITVHEGGVVKINDWPVPRCKVGDWTYSSEGEEAQKGTLWVEFLGASSYLVFLTNNSMTDFQGPYSVKPNEAFVMGDNRNNSHDSRMWWGGAGGGVPADHVQGRILGYAEAVLPKGAEGLGVQLTDCLKNKPAKTEP